MDSIKMSFISKQPIVDKKAAKELIDQYVGNCLFNNGQIVNDYLIAENGEQIFVITTLPEADSLDEKYNSVYVERWYKKICDLFDISIEQIGVDLKCGDSCNCKKPTWYMLYSDNTLQSPIVCGDCGQKVPLYKLPCIFDSKERRDVIDWAIAYNNITDLWLHGLSDRFTIRQRRHPESQLSQEGRKICKAYEEATGTPFYYYLFHTSLFHYKGTPKTCPICGKEWRVSDEKSIIDYKCEHCRIVADEE